MLKKNSVICFDKRQTNIAKGIAVLFLLWHHLFLYTPDGTDAFISIFSIRGIAIETVLAAYLRVCVAMFLFLSGYGLYKSWVKNNSKDVQYVRKKQFFISQLLFVKKHILKLLLGFCFIYILFVPLSIWFGQPFWEVYGNPFIGLLDFLGIADLVGTATMNQSWWFMSLIIVLYILFPILVGVMKKMPELLLAIATAVLLLGAFNFGFGVVKYNEYYLPFVFGMYFARINLFEFLSNRFNSNVKRIAIVLPVILICLVYRFVSENTVYLDFVFASSIILISYFFISKTKVLSSSLEVIGRNSDSIYMFHLFINYYYFQSYLFSLRYSLIIFLVYVIVCLLFAFLIHKMKKILFFDKLYSLL